MFVLSVVTLLTHFAVSGTEFHTLKFLIQHLYSVAQQQPTNKMGSENLGKKLSDIVDGDGALMQLITKYCRINYCNISYLAA